MATDDLDRLIDELAQDDPAIHSRVAAALERRELARQLAERRRSEGLTQTQLAKQMGTSQAQVTRFESGADTRLSTVARYAAAVGMKVEWTLARSPSRRLARAASELDATDRPRRRPSAHSGATRQPDQLQYNRRSGRPP